MADRNGFSVVTTVEEERYFIKEQIHYIHRSIARHSSEEAEEYDSGFLEYGPFPTIKVAIEEAEKVFRQRCHQMIDRAAEGLVQLLNLQEHIPHRAYPVSGVKLDLPSFFYSLFVEKILIESKGVVKKDREKAE